MSIATHECASMRTVENFENFKVYKTILGTDQLYITVSTTNIDQNIVQQSSDVYSELTKTIKDGGFEIVHERIFASLEFQNKILAERAKVYKLNDIAADVPFTFIQGNPISGKGLAGIQIRALRTLAAGNAVETIFHDDKAVGRKWSRNGTTFVMLQNIFGNSQSVDRYIETCDMFDRAQEILRQENLSFKNVLRTWIYLANILDWYDEFNRARNARFAEFGLLEKSEKDKRKAEHIYLPASTGILGENPFGASGTMDILAMPKDQQNVSVAHTSGVEQKSPYRYGSAFSRAMTLKEADVTHILLSGTASIDDLGTTVFLDDAAEQIRKTLTVVQALIIDEGASLQHINEATIFFKSAKDYFHYQQVANDFGNIDLPAIFIVADVCRDDLLFEIDAAIAF